MCIRKRFLCDSGEGLVHVALLDRMLHLENGVRLLGIEVQYLEGFSQAFHVAAQC